MASYSLRESFQMDGNTSSAAQNGSAKRLIAPMQSLKTLTTARIQYQVTAGRGIGSNDKRVQRGTGEGDIINEHAPLRVRAMKIAL
jgi:hypothetical protein